jgi:hypothetical protein
MRIKHHFILYGANSEHNRLVTDLLQLVIKADDHMCERSELLSRRGKSTVEIAQDKEYTEARKTLHEARKTLGKALLLVEADIVTDLECSKV